MRAKSVVLLITIGLFMSGDVSAEPRTQADLRIETLQAEVTDSSFQCRADVLNYHEDRARDVTLQILLPVGVRVALMPDSCSASPPAEDGSVGFVSCGLGNVPVGAKLERTVFTTRPPGAVRPSCGALIWSATPDPDPTNNQAAATADLDQRS